jgi:hypothetical protein
MEELKKIVIRVDASLHGMKGYMTREQYLRLDKWLFESVASNRETIKIKYSSHPLVFDITFANPEDASFFTLKFPYAIRSITDN